MKLKPGLRYAVRRRPWWRSVRLSFMPWAVVIETQGSRAEESREISEDARLNSRELAMQRAAELNAAEISSK